MKILFLGDSITNGAVASEPNNNFVSLVRDFTHYECLNFGVCGTRIAPQIHTFNGYIEFDDDFLNRSKRMPKDADLVFVFGGTNDFGHGDAPIGSIKDKEPTTFYGSLHSLYSQLIATYGKHKLAIILPLHRYDEQSTTGEFYIAKPEGSPILDIYVKAITDVASFYSLDILDFRNEFGEVDPNKKDSNEYISSDGLHPNDKGHYLIFKLIIKYLHQKGYIINCEDHL